MTKQGTWLEQWERVQRYYSLIGKLATNGIPPPSKNGPEIYFLDQVYAFFIFCYHLKDWMKNDSTLRLSPKRLVENFVHRNENACLQICGDICNGIKHLELDPTRIKRPWPAKFEGKADVSRKHVNGKLVSTKWKIFVLTDIGRINVFDLATECMEKWGGFINQNIGPREVED